MRKMRITQIFFADVCILLLIVVIDRQNNLNQIGNYDFFFIKIRYY